MTAQPIKQGSKADKKIVLLLDRIMSSSDQLPIRVAALAIVQQASSLRHIQ